MVFRLGVNNWGLKMAKMVEMDVMVETAKMENVDAKTNQ